MSKLSMIERLKLKIRDKLDRNYKVFQITFKREDWEDLYYTRLINIDEERIIEGLAKEYKSGSLNALVVANICDKVLDRSGQLLGEVRNVARKTIKMENVDKGHGICMEDLCKSFATKDYNGHGHWVCDYHYDKLNDEFDEEYR